MHGMGMKNRYPGSTSWLDSLYLGIAVVCALAFAATFVDRANVYWKHRPKEPTSASSTSVEPMDSALMPGNHPSSSSTSRGATPDSPSARTTSSRSSRVSSDKASRSSGAADRALYRTEYVKPRPEDRDLVTQVDARKRLAERLNDGAFRVDWRDYPLDELRHLEEKKIVADELAERGHLIDWISTPLARLEKRLADTAR